MLVGEVLTNSAVKAVKTLIDSKESSVSELTRHRIDRRDSSAEVLEQNRLKEHSKYATCSLGLYSRASVILKKTPARKCPV